MQTGRAIRSHSLDPEQTSVECYSNTSSARRAGRRGGPVGAAEGGQTLLKITRRFEGTFEEEDLGSVVFVPLMGEQGWAEDGRRAATNHVAGRSRTVPQMIADAAETLPDCDAPAFGNLFERFADRRVVLLGEASHGTAEFYRARAAITRRLIEHHGFTIVAVVGRLARRRRHLFENGLAGIVRDLLQHKCCSIARALRPPRSTGTTGLK